jgi:hypothetical protein
MAVNYELEKTEVAMAYFKVVSIASNPRIKLSSPEYTAGVLATLSKCLVWLASQTF